MKKDEVPQDHGNLSNSNMKELVYAVDEQGNYTTALSSGWEPKSIALSNSIAEINERVSEALEKVKQGQLSPIVYFMEKNKMNIGIVADYVGLWQWQIKRHFKPTNFAKLSETMLGKYAATFGITVAELKNFKSDKWH